MTNINFCNRLGSGTHALNIIPCSPTFSPCTAASRLLGLISLCHLRIKN
ncbi:hypothetical protein KPSA3_07517 [Pseudomonas syringae pv. actinidiae]|uniref:Uncharacterized protein n=1 Tax=Pseudomonas syringae pv. actinidiae TaxID=103796 RepID=A0AAN4QFK9_PSESF|nr:hypothetical protein KPSA3_07517 [Pseudomonas syringae pv. actinidiae]